MLNTRTGDDIPEPALEHTSYTRPLNRPSSGDGDETRALIPQPSLGDGSGSSREILATLISRPLSRAAVDHIDSLGDGGYHHQQHHLPGT